MYQYQKSNRYFAQVSTGLEELVKDELTELGATEIQEAFRGVYFSADPKTLYTVNYNARLLSRVLAPVISFKCHSTKYLYKTAYEFPWEDFIKLNETFAINAHTSNSSISHSKYASLKLKDAIADYFRGIHGERPDVDTTNPDVWINLHIENNNATISIDTSGGSLHKRGYRMNSVEAPMQETLAAAIIRLSDWKGEVPMLDPMCGSGTIVAEAHMALNKIPSGYLRRHFGFEKLPDFSKEIWKDVRSFYDGKLLNLSKKKILAGDKDAQAVSNTKINLGLLPYGESIPVMKRDYKTYKPETSIAMIVNPPYGIRLGKDEDLSGFYKDLGDYMKQNLTESTAYIYFGERKYLKNIGLRPTWKKPLSNGGLDGRLAKFELY
jgi:putative N6-adenine-specific DNA methylase